MNKCSKINIKGIDMEKRIKEKAAEELKSFIERSGEDTKKFIAKIQIFTDVLTVDYNKDETKLTNEISISLIGDTPEGKSVVYRNVVEYTNEDSEEVVMEKIVKAFPTKEEIEKAKKEAEERAKLEAEMMKKMQEQMANMKPEDLAKAALGQDDTNKESK